MIRKYFKAIVWVLVISMTISPSMVYAAAPSGGKQKIDLGYVTPDTAAAVVINPRHVLTAPEMELLPTEVITAAGIKYLGIDPAEVEQVLIIAEVSPDGPPGFGAVIHLASPVDQSKIFPQIMPATAEVQANGITYRKAPGPMGVCIYCPDDKTVIQATESVLKKMLENKATPKEGKMSKVLANFSNPPDALAVVQMEKIRPMIAPMLMMAPIPPQLAEAKKIPDLLTSIGAKLDLVGEFSWTLSLKANDEAAAEQVEKILDQVTQATQAQAATAFAQMEQSSDPVDKAMAKYIKRVNEASIQTSRPVRKGETLTYSFSPSKNPQAARVAVGGILVGLLLPAVQAARQAAERVKAQNSQPKPPPAIPVQ